MKFLLNIVSSTYSSTMPCGTINLQTLKPYIYCILYKYIYCNTTPFLKYFCPTHIQYSMQASPFIHTWTKFLYRWLISSSPSWVCSYSRTAWANLKVMRTSPPYNGTVVFVAFLNILIASSALHGLILPASIASNCKIKDNDDKSLKRKKKKKEI